ncbi:lipopolysaccharide kinase [Hirsutella rhossiliensis]|uniref:Lipopolysaccharide kinase (Kdo/WaaP) family domain-containing protein n=1 Tax=Hirsutella rhossiliensis TaxID=111463 RepID=A0A9P8MU88_9HYPO|nr:lipopolysaccharide kinase (Kdo/WaaP) family domain-containing protein [Hirsutella rhossiliensis]KAH0959307.1 lipopolysaccharide kinase (Kdo/WaaP) family domain-containing protein [Hirsutella rhossiliensis]
MEEIEDLRRQLREEQRRREEEQRRREEAEELAASSRPQILTQYLDACHSLQLAIDVVTEKSLTTQGDTTNPTGRIYPRRITPWHDFAARQQEIWTLLSASDSFVGKPALPSLHQLEYVKSLLQPISSELGLRDFERDVVENAVQKLVDGAHKDPLLRQSLGLAGTIKFESHTNLATVEDALSEPLQNLSLGNAPVTPRPSRRPHRVARGKGNRADQFCIYKTGDGVEVPALAIEYKAPHKLTVDELITGLKLEIQPDRDVINQDDQEGFDLSARRLAAAVVTQLFSYMIGKGIQYGYVCTGEAFVFLHIADDPSTVYYSVCVPIQDVADDDDDDNDDGTRLQGTAVAQVLAFVLQALRAQQPPETWHDDAETLGTWAVEFDDVLSRIPPSDRKCKTPRASPFKAQRWKGFHRSPIRTRARCKQQGGDGGVQPKDKDDESPSSSTLKPSCARPSPKTAGGGGSASGWKQGGGQRGKQQQKQRKQKQQQQQVQQLQDQEQQQRSPPAPKPNIKTRPFCTQACLLGLAHGGPIDSKCLNAQDHGPAHISPPEFLQLVQHQLATDRGRDADCTPLHLSGSRGSLFKVRLSSHGYTLVAKGVEDLDLICLQHEQDIYDRLRTIQGKHVPVCVGTVDLVLPYYYNCGVYVRFMFLSWAGQPLHRSPEQLAKTDMDAAVGTIFKALHRLRVLHRDAEPRNIVYNAEAGRLMVIDFERSEYFRRQPLGSVVANAQGCERTRAGLEKPKQQRDDFARELASVVRSTARYVADLAREQQRRACRRQSVGTPRLGFERHRQ